MLRLRVTIVSASLFALPLAMLFCAAVTEASPSKPPATQPVTSTAPPPPPPPVDLTRRLTKESRYAIYRALESELVYIRTAFPLGTKGLSLKDGTITPGGVDLERMLATDGPSVKPGDQARISNIFIKDHAIRLEINGGPVKKEKWYQKIEVGGGGGFTPIAPNDSRANARGSYVDLVFSDKVPDLTPAQLKVLLRPVFDFDAKSPIESYLETVPPAVKQAVRDHKVLVGMNREMVNYAKGRPDRKLREKDADGVEFEEWIYGAPPQPVEFVRLVGDEVIRLEIMQVSGQKEVRTDREVEVAKTLPGPEAVPSTLDPASLAVWNSPGTTKPTLRRPGETDPNADLGKTEKVPVLRPPSTQGDPPPDAPPPHYTAATGTR